MATQNAPKPDAALVKQVTDEVRNRLQAADAPPPGTQAAPGDFAKRFGKLVPKLSRLALEAAAIAADGQVSPSEMMEIAGKVVEFIQGFKKSPDAPAPAPAPSPVV